MTRNSLRFQIENILTPDIQELFEDPDFYIIDELTQKIGTVKYHPIRLKTSIT